MPWWPFLINVIVHNNTHTQMYMQNGKLCSCLPAITECKLSLLIPSHVYLKRQIVWTFMPKCEMIWKGCGNRPHFFCKPIIKNKMNHSANKWKNALPKQGKFVGHDVSTAFVCQFAKVFSPQDFWPRQHVWPSCRTHPSSALQFGDQHRALCCTCRRPPLPSPRTRWRSHWPAAWSWLSQIVSFYGWDVLYAINLDTGVFIA